MLSPSTTDLPEYVQRFVESHKDAKAQRVAPNLNVWHVEWEWESRPVRDLTILACNSKGEWQHFSGSYHSQAVDYARA